MNYRLVIFFILLLSIFSCNGLKKEDLKKEVLVITTLFPLYDFAKSIGREKVKVELLLPPGVDAHSFEPKPENIIKINKANVFVYTGKDMEPWVEKVINSLDNRKLIIVDASKGIGELKHDGDNKKDPHIWLDFENAKIIVDNILEGFVSADKLNEKFYEENALDLKEKLTNIDEDYKNGLSNCKTRYFFHAGHFAFGYLAKRFNLKYISAYPGLSLDEEPTPKRIGDMIRNIKKHNIRYVFYEELTTPRIAEVLSNEAGVTLLKINPGHNISKDDLEKGVTFVDIMEYNLKQLRIGLECQ